MNLNAAWSTIRLVLSLFNRTGLVDESIQFMDEFVDTYNNENNQPVPD